MINNNNPQNNRFSLTGNEYLDYLSWCEAVGIDIEDEKDKNNSNNEERENNIESNLTMIKTKGRDRYE